MVTKTAKPSGKLAASWRSKLAESGFQDLEGVDRDGALSDRGNLHESGDDEQAPLADRIASGEAYIDWARSVLHRMRDRRPAALRRRYVWQLHCDGLSLKEMDRRGKEARRRVAAGENAKAVGPDVAISFYTSREIVIKIQEKYRCPRESGNNRQRRVAARIEVRAVRSTTTLMALAASLAKAELMTVATKASRTLTRFSTPHFGA